MFEFLGMEYNIQQLFNVRLVALGELTLVVTEPATSDVVLCTGTCSLRRVTTHLTVYIQYGSN